MESDIAISRGRDIGLSGYQSYCNFAWIGCSDCGNLKWRRMSKGEVAYPRCGSCAAKRRGMRRGDKHPNWKGGAILSSGYTLIKVQPDNFFIGMANRNNYIAEHRLVMAKFLGRCLHSWEIVHHRNKNKQDNRIKNLQLVSDDRHKQITVLETKIKRQSILISDLKRQLNNE